MNTRWWLFLSAAAVFTFAVWVGAKYTAQADSGLSAQINKEGGVIVKVTPRRLAPSAETWEFEVVFETHTVALAGDPARFSTLVDAEGRTHSPSSGKATRLAAIIARGHCGLSRCRSGTG